MSYDCYCDYDQPLFYSQTKPRARKVYRCEECRGPISIGEQYEYMSGKWPDYGIETFRTCERCHDIRVWLTNNLPCFCWAHGEMFENAIEDIREAKFRAPDETRGLLFGYYRRVVKRDKYNKAHKVTA